MMLRHLAIFGLQVFNISQLSKQNLISFQKTFFVFINFRVFFLDNK